MGVTPRTLWAQERAEKRVLLAQRAARIINRYVPDGDRYDLIRRIQRMRAYNRTMAGFPSSRGVPGGYVMGGRAEGWYGMVPCWECQ
jgi:hypothetical protein